nr:G protein-coupled receptor [Proales similis]
MELMQPSVAASSARHQLNDSGADSNLLDSISILKNIIDKLGKIPLGYNYQQDKVEGSAVDNLFALAKNSVTLSFQDYLSLQRATLSSQDSGGGGGAGSSTTTHVNMLATRPTLNSPAFIGALFNLSLNLTTTDLDDLISHQDFNTATDASQHSQSYLLLGIAFFYTILIITSLTSNPLLIFVLLWRRKSQLKLIDVFVANLSISDLFLTIFNIPLCLIIFFSRQWPFGSLICQFGTYSTSCSIYVNTLTMAYISVDRYFAVTRPCISNPNGHLRKQSILLDNAARKKIYRSLALIWLISLVLSVPQFMFSRVSKVHTEHDPLLIDHNLGKLASNSSIGIELEAAFLESSELNEDPFKKCIVAYPIGSMKIFMVLINFSLQYLIPSIVILYFYGKIIYHLYLNLNVEELMEAPVQRPTRRQTKMTGSISVQAFSSAQDGEKVKAPRGKSSSLANANLSEINPVIETNRMRIEGLNRTRNLKKSIKIMVIIIALFLLSWLPIHTYRLLTTFYPIISRYFQPSQSHLANIDWNSLSACEPNKSASDCISQLLIELTKGESHIGLNTLHNRYVFFFCYMLAMSSVCYNPIVYFWMHKKFRAEVKRIFFLKPRLSSPSATNTYQSAYDRRFSRTTTCTSTTYKTKYSIVSLKNSLNEELRRDSQLPANNSRTRARALQSYSSDTIS